jgi:hypothetical protein
MPPGTDAMPGGGAPPYGQPGVPPGYSVPYGQPGVPPGYSAPPYAPPVGAPPEQYQYPYPYGYQPPPGFPPQVPQPARSSQSLLWILLSVGAVVVLVVAVLGVALLSNHTTHLTGPNGSTLPAGAYSAAVPGPGCDTKGGNWTADSLTQTTCTGGKLHISSQFIATVSFLGPTSSSAIAKNYEVSVAVTPLDSLGAGIIAPESSTGPNGYEIDIDSTGFWIVFDETGNSATTANLPSGTVNPATTYQLSIVVRGTTDTIKIDGNQVGQFDTSAFTSGNGIGLSASKGKTTAEADFQNFTYTPLN